MTDVTFTGTIVPKDISGMLKSLAAFKDKILKITIDLETTMLKHIDDFGFEIDEKNKTFVRKKSNVVSLQARDCGPAIVVPDQELFLAKEFFKLIEVQKRHCENVDILVKDVDKFIGDNEINFSNQLNGGKDDQLKSLTDTVEKIKTTFSETLDILNECVEDLKKR